MNELSLSMCKPAVWHHRVKKAKMLNKILTVTPVLWSEVVPTCLYTILSECGRTRSLKKGHPTVAHGPTLTHRCGLWSDQLAPLLGSTNVYYGGPCPTPSVAWGVPELWSNLWAPKSGCSALTSCYGETEPLQAGVLSGSGGGLPICIRFSLSSAIYKVSSSTDFRLLSWQPMRTAPCIISCNFISTHNSVWQRCMS